MRNETAWAAFELVDTAEVALKSPDEMIRTTACWRFLASLHPGVVSQLLPVQGRMRQRVWQATGVECGSRLPDSR